MKHVIRMFLLLLTVLLTCSLCIACSGDRDPAQTTAEDQTKAVPPIPCDQPVCEPAAWQQDSHRMCPHQ